MTLKEFLKAIEEIDTMEGQKLHGDISTGYTYGNKPSTPRVAIKKVIFNPPATIVLWTDGTKTVVKAQNGEDYDPEKGLAMAITKRAFGNKGNYYNELKPWLDEYYAEADSILTEEFEEALAKINEIFK